MKQQETSKGTPYSLFREAGLRVQMLLVVGLTIELSFTMFAAIVRARARNTGLNRMHGTRLSVPNQNEAYFRIKDK